MKLDRIHHVAYRCNDAKETVDFYQRVLNMDFMLAFAEDQVPSTKEPDPYMHVFLDAGMGNVLAFFELPTRPEMDRDHEAAAIDPSQADGLYKGPSRGHVQKRYADLIGIPRG